MDTEKISKIPTQGRIYYESQAKAS